jgi:hypothetical protein
MPAEAEVHLDVLWDDNGVINNTATIASLTGSTFRVTTTGNHGNAGIALRDNTTNDIYWSWHIWVTDYDPSIPENTWTNPHSTTFTFMNRNLGATQAVNAPAGHGLMYSWGRKDPMPNGSGAAGYNARSSFSGMPDAGSTTLCATSGTVAEAIIQSIRYPTTHYIGGHDYDWLPARTHDLWNVTVNGKHKKTVYDPCPNGWRVPVYLDGHNSGGASSNSPWYNIPTTTTTVNGINTLGIFQQYPRNGYRNVNNASLQYAYNNGMGTVWSASWRAYNNGFCIWFLSDGGINKSYEKQGYAMGVRCVKDNNP